MKKVRFFQKRNTTRGVLTRLARLGVLTYAQVKILSKPVLTERELWEARREYEAER